MSCIFCLINKYIYLLYMSILIKYPIITSKYNAMNMLIDVDHIQDILHMEIYGNKSIT